MVGNKLGEAYLGYSHIVSDNPLRVAGAFEVLHSFEGWNLRDNYFGETTTGNGTIDTVLWQYQFSLARYLWAPKEFWGQGPDLVVSTFGMWNHVSSDEPGFTAPTDKLKLGASGLYSPRPWLGVDLRYDLVQPDMADRTYSFHVVSPTVVLRSKFARRGGPPRLLALPVRRERRAGVPARDARARQAPVPDQRGYVVVGPVKRSGT